MWIRRAGDANMGMACVPVQFSHEEVFSEAQNQREKNVTVQQVMLSELHRLEHDRHPG